MRQLDTMARNLDDILVYQKAMKASEAVSAILKRPNFNKDLNLKGQLPR
jgi:hypothetical protein